MNKEMRYLQMQPMEVREIGESGEKVIVGYVNKFNQESEILRDRWGDEFVEVIATGAFDKTLQTRSQKALWNHNNDLVLGSVKSNTLTLMVDDMGLRCEIKLPNTTAGNDAFESVKRGDVDGMSFGFRCIEDMWSKIERDGKEVYKRTILECELYEVSPCTFPAYSDSSIDCRSLDTFKGEVRQAKIKELIIKTYL